MKKKITALALVICLLAVAVVGGTLAYFTATDKATNTFTMGNISIEQFEKEGVYNEAGEPTGLVDFSQDKLIMPAAGEPRYDGVYMDFTSLVGAGSSELWAKHMNAQDKFVFVKNTGNQPLYYRTIIAIECPEGVTLRTNVNGYSKFDHVTDQYVTVNGTRYECCVATYTDPLAKDEVCRPSLLQVALDKDTTQEQMVAFGEKVDAIVFTQAVQAEGFADLYDTDTACNALNDAFGEITVDNLGTWIEKVTSATP